MPPRQPPKPHKTNLSDERIKEILTKVNNDEELNSYEFTDLQVLMRLRNIVPLVLRLYEEIEVLEALRY